MKKHRVITRGDTGEEVTVPCPHPEYKTYGLKVTAEEFRRIYAELYPNGSGDDVDAFYTCDDGKTYITQFKIDTARYVEVDEKYLKSEDSLKQGGGGNH